MRPGRRQALAGLRRAALAQAGGGIPHAAWQVVSLQPSAMSEADPDRVSVRILGDQGPMAGASVYFNCAPHSGCVGKASGDGVATCRLVDQHGDDGDHDDAAAPVVATFPGVVGERAVLLPTTVVVRR